MFRGFVASVLAGTIKGRFWGRLRSKKSICPRIYTISLSAYQLFFIFGSNMAYVMLGALRDLERYIEKCYNTLIQRRMTLAKILKREHCKGDDCTMKNFIRIFLGALVTVLFAALMITNVIYVISEILGAGATERRLQRINILWTYNDLLMAVYLYGFISLAGIFIIIFLLKRLPD